MNRAPIQANTSRQSKDGTPICEDQDGMITGDRGRDGIEQRDGGA